MSNLLHTIRSDQMRIKISYSSAQAVLLNEENSEKHTHTQIKCSKMKSTSKQRCEKWQYDAFKFRHLGDIVLDEQ